MHSRTSVAAALAAVACLISCGSAHSWVEQLSVIAPNGTFTGAPGFARGNALRQGNTAVDKAMVYLLPPDGRDASQGILPSDTMCFPDHQQQAKQTDGSPRLQAAPGDLVALRYQENGHVTLPENQPGKPANRGTIYVYGTTQSSPNDKFVDIFGKWNADGTGGNKRGKLLGTYNFDDGRCYQINGGPISAARQKQFPHTANQLMGADLWCQNDVPLPQDAPTGKPYTLYWAWSWPTAAGTPGVPNGKTEIYTSCLDIDITGGQGATKNAAVQFAQGQPIDEAAVPEQLSAIAKGNAMIAGTSILAAPQTQNAPQAPSPNAQAPAPASTAPVASQPPAAQQPQNAPAPAPAAASQATITLTQPPKTVYVTISQTPATPTSTTIMTVPKSTVVVEPTETANAQSVEPGVPAISLAKSFSGTASPIAAAPMASGNSPKPYQQKRSKVFVNRHVAARL